jgi:hypothetical protein
MGFSGFSQAVYLIGIFTPLQKRVGTVGILRLCSGVWPFFFSLGPILNTFRRHEAMVPFWLFGPLGLCVGSGVAMAFSESERPSLNLFLIGLLLTPIQLPYNLLSMTFRPHTGNLEPSMRSLSQHRVLRVPSYLR